MHVDGGGERGGREECDNYFLNNILSSICVLFSLNTDVMII